MIYVIHSRVDNVPLCFSLDDDTSFPYNGKVEDDLDFRGILSQEEAESLGGTIITETLVETISTKDGGVKLESKHTRKCNV